MRTEIIPFKKPSIEPEDGNSQTRDSLDVRRDSRLAPSSDFASSTDLLGYIREARALVHRRRVDDASSVRVSERHERRITPDRQDSQNLIPADEKSGVIYESTPAPLADRREGFQIERPRSLQIEPLSLTSIPFEPLSSSMPESFEQSQEDIFPLEPSFKAELSYGGDTFSLTPLELEPLSFKDALDAPLDTQVNLLVNGAAMLEKRKYEPPPLTKREARVIERKKGQILKALDEVLEQGVHRAGRLVASKLGKRGLSLVGATGLAMSAAACASGSQEITPLPLPPEPIAKEASATPTAKFDFSFMKRPEQGGELEPFDGTIADPEDGSKWGMVKEDFQQVGSYPGTFDGWVDMESIPVDEREEGVRWGLWSNGVDRGRVRFVRVEESEKAQFGEGYEVALRYANEIGYQIAIVDPEGNLASKWLDINSEDSAVDTQNGQILALWHVPAGGQKSPDYPWFFSYSEYDSSGNLKRVFSDNFSFDHSPDE